MTDTAANLRVATYNIRASIGPGPFPDRWWDRIDADRLRAIGVLLGSLDLDLVALQEVAVVARDGRLIDNAGEFARQLGMEPFDHGSVQRETTFHRTTLLDQGKSLYAAIVERKNAGASSLGAAATVVDLLSHSCDATRQEDIWLSGMHTIAQWSLSFLSSSDATALVATALPAECAATGTARKVALPKPAPGLCCNVEQT